MKTKFAADLRRGTQHAKPQRSTTRPQPPGSPARGDFSRAGVGVPPAASLDGRYLESLRKTERSSGIRVQMVLKRLSSFVHLFLAILREIFDENAYQRFLDRTGQSTSIQSYREFQREREVGIATRPRCC